MFESMQVCKFPKMQESAYASKQVHKYASKQFYKHSDKFCLTKLWFYLDQPNLFEESQQYYSHNGHLKEE